MQKNVRELIPMLILIEESFSRLYHNISVIEGRYNPQLKTAAAVLSRQETEHAAFYSKLMKNKDLLDDVFITEEFYAKVRDTLSSFRSSIAKGSYNNIKELLDFAISYEKKNGDMLKELLADLEDRHQAADEDSQRDFKALLNELIKAEETHSNTLRSFLR